MPLYDCGSPDCLSCIDAFRREYRISTARRPQIIVEVTGPGDTDKTFSGVVVRSCDPLNPVGTRKRDWLEFAFKPTNFEEGKL